METFKQVCVCLCAYIIRENIRTIFLRECAHTYNRPNCLLLYIVTRHDRVAFARSVVVVAAVLCLLPFLFLVVFYVMYTEPELIVNVDV